MDIALEYPPVVNLLPPPADFSSSVLHSPSTRDLLP